MPRTLRWPASQGICASCPPAALFSCRNLASSATKDSLDELISESAFSTGTGPAGCGRKAKRKMALSIVVVGGGIGGLFAANALIAQGFDVAVYEQAPALGEVGAGVFLPPNSVRH